MDAGDRLNLVAAAAIAVGPAADQGAGTPGGETWQDRVRQKAVDLYVMAKERGSVGRALEQLDECRTYVATVVGGKVERHALDDGGELTRGLVKLRVEPSKWTKDGVEYIRTELLSTSEGRILWEQVRELVGHRVLVYAQTEVKDDRKVKTFRHVEDLGPDRNGNDQ